MRSCVAKPSAKVLYTDANRAMASAAFSVPVCSRAKLVAALNIHDRAPCSVASRSEASNADAAAARASE